MIDAFEGLTAQDAHVAGFVVEEGRGLVLALNKWDLLAEKTDRSFVLQLRPSNSPTDRPAFYLAATSARA